MEPCQGEEQHLVSRFTRKNAFKSFPYSQPFLIHKYNDNRIDNNVLLLGLEQSRSFLLEYIHNIEYILGMDKSELRNLNFQRSKTDFQKNKSYMSLTICKSNKSALEKSTM